MLNLYTDTSFPKIIRVSAILWLLYLAVITLTDKLFIADSAFPSLFRLFYVPSWLTALLFFGLAYWSLPRRKLRQAFLPLMICINLVLPQLTNAIIRPLLPEAPTLTAEGMALRVVPIVAVTLILATWQYQWRFIVILIVIASIVRGTYLWITVGPNNPEFYPGFLALMMFPFSFFTIGYFIRQLFNQLRTQQESLHQTNSKLQHYASTLEQLAITRERNRIARELHDTLAHTLSALSVQLESTKAYWDIDADTALAMLETSLNVTRSGLEETRRVLKAVRASPLDDLGLKLAITQLAQDAASRGDLALELDIPDQLLPVAPDVEQCIFRISQEAIANVLHHANATCLQVCLHQNVDAVTLRIRDNGAGFDAKSAKTPGHYGLVGMEERADLSGGTLTVETHPGHGTTVQLAL